MDYKKAASEVLQNIGGKDNIVSAAHCATRLRLVIADNGKVNKKELENATGVQGVFEAQGQLQIIFGTGTVNKVYDEFIALSGAAAVSKDEAKAQGAAKGNWFQRAIKTLGDIFVPIIPAIVASGFLMGIMESLNFMVNNGFIEMNTSSSIYMFAQLFSNVAYTFLPILIAFSAAKVFGGNPFLGAVIGMIMLHPNLQSHHLHPPHRKPGIHGGGAAAGRPLRPTGSRRRRKRPALPSEKAGAGNKPRDRALLL